MELKKIQVFIINNHIDIMYAILGINHVCDIDYKIFIRTF